MFFTLSRIGRIVVVPFVVLILHTVAIVFLHVYDRWPWFDMPMHVIGGMSIAIAATILLREARAAKQVGAMRSWFLVLVIVSMVAFVATMWELWEYAMDFWLLFTWQQSITDTMGDMALGLTGGLVMGLYTVKKYGKYLS